jgi:hypothetical protein
MSRIRLASGTLAVSAVLFMAGGGTALASHGGGGGGGGGGGTPPPAPAGAPAVSIAPSTVSFGPLAVGTTSATQAVTVTNTGTAPAFFNAESQGGNNVLDFTDTNSQCVGTSLAPGASCALTLGFRPTATGTRTGTVELFDNAPDSPQIINLSGTGTSTAGPTPLTVDTTGLTCTSGGCALADSIVNNFYFASLSASGDTQPPFTWALAAGTLPAGLSLAANGQISGSSTTTGTSTFTVKVTDPSGKTATQAFSITIDPPPALGPAGCPKIGGQPSAVSAPLSGPAIAGRVPSGQAVLDESRVTTCGGFSVLGVSVSNVNLPNNTVLWIYFDSRLVGRVALVNGAAKMPAFDLGDYLSRKDAVAVYDTPPPVTTLEPAVLSSGFLH